MALPRQHTWICLYYGNDADCATCHPQPTCKNCGHTALAHSYTDEAATFGWCPRCRGCGSRPQQEEKIMKHLLVTVVTGETHTMGIGPQGEDATVEMFAEAMNSGRTLTFKNLDGQSRGINGAHIVSFKVENVED